MNNKRRLDFKHVIKISNATVDVRVFSFSKGIKAKHWKITITLNFERKNKKIMLWEKVKITT